jgi:hypothetical protein
MNEKIEAFSNRCKKLPARLREYNAYKTLKVQIEDFQIVLPILQEFTKESIRDRHWEEVCIDMYIYVYVYIHIHIYIDTYIYIYMNICICIHTYIQTYI